jgi:hypothetical protein
MVCVPEHKHSTQRERCQNCLSNALRHTSAGGVVSVSAAQVDGYAKVSVADTGAGIAPADLPYCISYPPGHVGRVSYPPPGQVWKPALLTVFPGHVGRVSYPPPLGRYGNLPYLPYFLDT